jgi:hypothetical protein
LYCFAVVDITVLIISHYYYRFFNMLSFSACHATIIFTAYTWLCNAERRDFCENLTRDLRGSSRNRGLWRNLLEAGEEEHWSQKNRTFGG